MRDPNFGGFVSFTINARTGVSYAKFDKKNNRRFALMDVDPTAASYRGFDEQHWFTERI